MFPACTTLRLGSVQKEKEELAKDMKGEGAISWN